MMNFLQDRFPLIYDSRNKALMTTSKFFTPVLFCGTLLIVISYITDLIYTKTALLNLGETTSVASSIYSIGSIISKLSLPFISMMTAFFTGGVYAIVSGIIGGILIISGSTSQNITGSITGVSGVLGCIAAGYLGGYTAKLLRKIFVKKPSRTSLEIFFPALSLVLTLLGVLAINSISAYLSSASNTLLVFTGEKQSIILPVLLGLFITADPGGPLFLSAYIFGASSLATGQSQIMAAVAAAGMVPALSIGLFAFLYKERLEPFERVTAYCASAASLAGISQLSFPFYVSRSYKFILPCVPGGCISAILTVLFKCRTDFPMGGFITFTRQGKPLFFLVAIICGVITSTALMSLTIKSKDTEEGTDGAGKPNHKFAQA